MMPILQVVQLDICKLRRYFISFIMFCCVSLAFAYDTDLQPDMIYGIYGGFPAEAISPDGKRVLLAYQGYFVLDIITGNLIYARDFDDLKPFNDEEANAITYSPDGNFIAMAG